MPPVCTSIVSPSRSSDIAEHSTCQPGKPLPHGESQVISRFSPACFHSAQSAWKRLPVAVDSPVAPCPARSWSRRLPLIAPYDGKDRASK